MYLNLCSYLADNSIIIYWLFLETCLLSFFFFYIELFNRADIAIGAEDTKMGKISTDLALWLFSSAL